MHQKKLVLLFLLALNCFVFYGQQIIKETNYTLLYYPNTIEIDFNSDVAGKIRLEDAFTHQQVEINQLSASKFKINAFRPAQIFKLEYSMDVARTSNPIATYIATPSTSTGTINVYFNHPVDTGFAQIQNAVNLSNTMATTLITYMNNCQSTMDIAIYSSYSPSATTGIAGAINAAYNRGVQVRVIYDGSASNFIPLLNANIPRLPSPTTIAYTIMHNKFVIFDANNSNAAKPFVWTGSTNWTTSQINGPDKNSAIVIQDQALALGYKIEFEEMWGSTTAIPNVTNSKFGQFKTDNTPHHYIIGGKTIDSYFSPSDGTTAKIISCLNSANSDCEAAVMDITKTNCSAAIINRYNAGVLKSYVIVDGQNPAGNQITTLQNTLTTSKAVVYNNTGIMHHKFVVIDNYNAASDPQVLLGSHNWSASAETKNDENTLIVHDLNITNQYFQAFAYLFQLSGGVLNTLTYQETAFSIYPNPSKGIYSFTTTDEFNANWKLSVYNCLGQKILTASPDSLTNNTIDLTEQPIGMYFFEFESINKTYHYKVIKN